MKKRSSHDLFALRNNFQGHFPPLFCRRSWLDLLHLHYRCRFSTYSKQLPLFDWKSNPVRLHSREETKDNKNCRSTFFVRFWFNALTKCEKRETTTRNGSIFSFFCLCRLTNCTSCFNYVFQCKRLITHRQCRSHRQDFQHFGKKEEEKTQIQNFISRRLFFVLNEQKNRFESLPDVRRLGFL